MVKNLDTDHYRNGDPIPEVKDTVQWSKLTTGAWCYYNNDSAHGKIYGKLYNWYAVNDPRGLAPAGWHIPGDKDWSILEIQLGGIDKAGGKMKETDTTHWASPNEGATNSSGFMALPGGYRYVNGKFYDLGASVSWWSAAEASVTDAWARGLSSDGESVGTDGAYKRSGFSVRCVKD